MSFRLSRLVRRILLAATYVAAGALAVLVIGFVAYLDSRPGLAVWHLADLDEELTASSAVATFQDYLELEERLFAQLGEQVYAKIPADARRLINRYNPSSLSDPARWSPNWNRSFELPAEKPKAGILLSRRFRAGRCRAGSANGSIGAVTAGSGRKVGAGGRWRNWIAAECLSCPRRG
jgi:hypothetical protein